MAVLSQYASEQWGMMTSAQARRGGVSRVDLNRLVHDGVLESVQGAARVYRLTGSPENPDMDGLRAAWLQLGGERTWGERIKKMDAVVSHRSAAHARSLGDQIEWSHEFYVSERKQPARTDLRLRLRTGLEGVRWAVWGGLPVATIDQIIEDLLADWEDESAVAQICLDAARDGLLTAEALLAVVTPFAKRYGYTAPEQMVGILLGPRF